MLRQALTDEKLQFDKVTLDAQRAQVTGPNGTHRLTPKESDLLTLFMHHPGQVISRRSLMKVVWETDFLDDTRTLEVHICLLRKKIEANPNRPRYLRTVRGKGYGFGLE